ncbi:hypothetical protein KRX52_13145 [Pseudomonas sp. MAP12]|uniref:Uncharacterized protein n=1 Tax=Geopseudomonas aromaticivorans TaxID=2849492 RepID=A0ABS6MY44_9GAMM|nr:hypothetical protein [Pseudomonas aromaticivorans]MBV2133726.1 hypothetical protein [Pseudomonas aromaticivorans]
MPITGLYAVMAVSLLVQIVLLARGLRNRDKDNLTTYLQEITALRLGQTTIVQQVEQKLDDKLGSVSNTLKTELSDEIQRIYDKINTERSSMSEALEARLSEDHDQLKNICSQLETQIGNVTQQLDAMVQNTQHRVEELDNVIQSVIEASKVADQKFESRFECLEDNLQYRADRLHRSIRSIAEDSKSANHDLESRLQYLEGSFHAIQMLPKDDRIKDLKKKKHVDEQLEQFTDSLTCLESFMIKEIETFQKDIITRLKDHWDASEAESLQSQAPTPPRYHDYSSKVVTRTPLVYPATMVEKPASKKHPQGQMAYVWQPIQLKDLKNIKESVVSYGLHSPYIKQLLHSWATFNTVMPTDWE